MQGKIQMTPSWFLAAILVFFDTLLLSLNIDINQYKSVERMENIL
jgi:hypothetical protein